MPVPDSSPVLIVSTVKLSPSGSVSFVRTPFEAFFVPVAPASIARVSSAGTGGSLIPLTVIAITPVSVLLPSETV